MNIELFQAVDNGGLFLRSNGQPEGLNCWTDMWGEKVCQPPEPPIHLSPPRDPISCAYALKNPWTMQFARRVIRRYPELDIGRLESGLRNGLKCEGSFSRRFYRLIEKLRTKFSSNQAGAAVQ